MGGFTKEPKETKSGFEVFMENVESLKNKQETQKKEQIAKNLQTFQISYNKFKENPTAIDKHTIVVQPLSEYEMYTIQAIRAFLKEEKWPDNKISIDSKNGITVNFAIAGWFRNDDD